MKTMTKKQEEAIRNQKIANAIANLNPDKNTFSDIIPFIFSMRRYERRLQHLAEIECNGYPKPVTEYRDGKHYFYNVEDLQLKANCERRERTIKATVGQLAALFNLTPEFQGDPRGIMFTLKTKDGHEIRI